MVQVSRQARAVSRLAFLVSAAIAALSPAAAQQAALATLPLSAFAQIPFIEDPSLSPDGKRLAGLFGIDGHQIIAITDLFDTSAKRIMLNVPDGTEAAWIRWVNNDNIIVALYALLPAPDGKRIYVSRLLAVNRISGKYTKLAWDLAGQNAAEVLRVPGAGSAEILLAAQDSIYAEDGYWPSVYRVNVETARKSKILTGQAGIFEWAADSSGTVRTGVGYRDDLRRFRLVYRASERSGIFRTIDAADTRKRETLMRPFLFLPGTDHALALHDDASGRSGVFEVDLLTQKDVRTVYAASNADGEVDGPILSDDGNTLLGVTTLGIGSGYRWVDPAIAELQAQLDKAVGNARARILSFNEDRSKMLVSVTSPDTPGLLYYYDTAGGKMHLVAKINDAIGSQHLSPVKLVHYTARDGTPIEAVLTLPLGADPRKLAFVMLPHGGPWANDGLYYDYWAQFLASRGYAVLQPNFRGSTGYGTDFLRKGEGQLGLAMQDDLSDGVRWAVDQGIADPARVCIVGGSYGGYAAMWGIAKDPALYRCAISIAGVSSLSSEVNDFGHFLMGGKFKDDWRRMTPDFPAVSPLNAVARITTPLLLIHGKKDVTVDPSQSSRMFAKMQQAGKTVEFISRPLADHHFTREADRTTLLGAMETFLAKYNPAIVSKGTSR